MWHNQSIRFYVISRAYVVFVKCAPVPKLRILSGFYTAKLSLNTRIIFISEKLMVEIRPDSAYWAVHTNIKLRKMCGM